MSEIETPREAILEPRLPIVDPHHHLWDRRAFAGVGSTVTHGFNGVVRMTPVYLLDQLLADVGSGHNVRMTVFVECGAMYRADGPGPMRSVGEVEFVNGVAAMSASGLYGRPRVCAGVVGRADLALGAAVDPVLEALIAAGGGRLRGVREGAAWDADARVLGPLVRAKAGLYHDTAFREGFARLARHGLSFDAWLLEPQLDDLIDLARAFPETPIVLDHVGAPLGIASYAGRREERFPIWRDKIRELAACPNVSVKLGGLAMPFAGFASFMSTPPATSAQLAEEWRPYIETCIEAFGAPRAMFESNFPVDRGSCAYDVLWNAFKIIAKDCSAEEKAELFSGAASRFYRLSL
jgi:L-fuconolactonase